MAAGQVWPAGRSEVRHVFFRSDDSGASVDNDNESQAAEGAFDFKWPSQQLAVTTFKDYQSIEVSELDLEHESVSQWQPAAMQQETSLVATLEDAEQPQTLDISSLVWREQTAPEIGADPSQQATAQRTTSLAWSQGVPPAPQEDLHLDGPAPAPPLSSSPPADSLTPSGCMRKGTGGVKGSQASLQHSDWNNRTVTMPKQLHRAATPAHPKVPTHVLDYSSRNLDAAPVHFVW